MALEPKPPKEVDRHTARSIRFYSTQPVELLNRRIQELEWEVPLEMFVFRGGAVLTVVSLLVLLFRRKSRSWLIIALFVTALQLQYSQQGQNILTDILRNRGYRSRREIEAEKNSLKALRGDFAVFSELSDPIERARKCLDLFL
jgi:hypothetical protein